MSTPIDYWIWHPYTDGSLAYRLRMRRWKMLKANFPSIEEMRVLDIGGVAEAWQGAPYHPAEVVLLNIHHYTPNSPEPWMTTLVGDACEPDDDLKADRFDLVVSNSVIEHVGGHYRRQQFAETVRSLSDSYWVQTPYRYFPIEPHWIFPGAQFLPKQAKIGLTKYWPVGNYRLCQETSEATEDVMWVELQSIAEMRHYFPDAEILRERFGGPTKSIIACRVGS